MLCQEPGLLIVDFRHLGTFNEARGRGQRTEDGGRRTEDGGRKTEGGEQD
jgi:hypothetical protein